ncbi:MAG: hypothetical protein P8077_08885 [Gammaproteobacteria bacterium]
MISSSNASVTAAGHVNKDYFSTLPNDLKIKLINDHFVSSSSEAEKAIPMLASVSKDMRNAVNDSGALRSARIRYDILREKEPEGDRNERLRFAKKFRRYATHSDPLVVKTAEKSILARINSEVLHPSIVYSAYFIRHPSQNIVTAVAKSLAKCLEDKKLSFAQRADIGSRLRRIHLDNRRGGAFKNPEHRWLITEAFIRSYMRNPEAEIIKFRKNREAYVHELDICV